MHAPPARIRSSNLCSDSISAAAALPLARAAVCAPPAPPPPMVPTASPCGPGSDRPLDRPLDRPAAARPVRQPRQPVSISCSTVLCVEQPHLPPPLGGLPPRQALKPRPACALHRCPGCRARPCTRPVACPHRLHPPAAAAAAAAGGSSPGGPRCVCAVLRTSAAAAAGSTTRQVVAPVTGPCSEGHSPSDKHYTGTARYSCQASHRQNSLPPGCRHKAHAHLEFWRKQ